MEMIVVLVVIGLIATMVVPQVMGMLDSAKSKTARLQLNNVEQAVRYFEIDMGRYPTSEEGLAVLLEAPEDDLTWMGPYLSEVRQLRDPWNRELRYEERDGGYRLWTLGADGEEGGKGDDADLELAR